MESFCSLPVSVVLQNKEKSLNEFRDLKKV